MSELSSEHEMQCKGARGFVVVYIVVLEACGSRVVCEYETVKEVAPETDSLVIELGQPPVLPSC